MAANNPPNSEGLDADARKAETRVRESEARLKEIEVALKEKELADYKVATKISRRSSLFSLSTPVLIALVGIAGTALGAALQGFLNLQLEREKFRAQLIQKATETGSPEDKANSLRFLTETGLIDDPGGKIIEYANNKKQQIPTLLPINSAQQNSIVGDGWIFIGTYRNGQWIQPTVNIQNGVPEKGSVYTVIDDVYLRDSKPTESNQRGSVVKVITAGTGVQITDVYQVPNSSNYWCQISITSSGSTPNPNTSSPSNNNIQKRYGVPKK